MNQRNGFFNIFFRYGPTLLNNVSNCKKLLPPLPRAPKLEREILHSPTSHGLTFAPPIQIKVEIIEIK